MIEQAVADLGRTTRTVGEGAVDLTRFIGAALRSVLHYPATARGLVLRNLRNQIYFTAFQALFFLGTIALLLGVTVIVQVHAQGLTTGFSDVLGKILETVVVRELGPILTAIVVIGRSGTAIAAELATNSILGETDAMEALGVDPLQYLVIPRIIGGAISVALLTVYFNFITLIAGAGAAWMLGALPTADYAESLRRALSPLDLWLTVIKGGVFGAGIATLCAYASMLGAHKPTDIPRSVTRGVVLSLLFVFVTSAIFSLIIYA